LDFGEEFLEELAGLAEVDTKTSGELYRIEIRDSIVRAPTDTLYMIDEDLDEDEYDFQVKKHKNTVNKDGFDIFFKDWVKADSYEKIKGKNWLNKYDNDYATVKMDSKRKGNIAVVVYGVCALVNVVLSIVVWFTSLGKFIPNKDYSWSWYAWFSAFLIHLLIWSPLLILWPLAYIGTVGILRLINIFAQIAMYGGVYGGYGVTLVLLVLGVGINIDQKWSGTVGLGWALVSVYVVVAGLSGFLSMWFYKSLFEWFQNVVIEELDEDEYEIDENGGLIIQEQST
jgi:hypothetical protein